MSFNETDASIIAQVAAKVTAEITSDVADFSAAFPIVLDDLVKGVQSAVEALGAVSKSVTVPAPSGGAATATQGLASNGMFTLSIKGQQHGPIPDWAVAKAAEEGITEVWDNRDKLSENPKYPWFKSTGSDKTPFWPAK